MSKFRGFGKPQKQQKRGKLAFLDYTQFDRQWFELHPGHKMLVRESVSEEVRCCERDMKFTPDVTLVYDLARGLGATKVQGRIRLFARYEDTLEQRKELLGHTIIKRYTIAEIVGDHSLPYGMASTYTHLREGTDSSSDDQETYGLMG